MINTFYLLDTLSAMKFSIFLDGESGQINKKQVSYSNKNHRLTHRAGAGYLNRVCRAWHRTSEVRVLVPGVRGAEG
ncbi:MAG: hypothetical protein SWO11_21595 [Thermodesulfobacteriota bacterium]|nr:hypothetical protein [Thermodesulfobacteriota bacterium]